MATIPCAKAMAKAPPPEVLQRYAQDFANLTGTADDTPPQSERDGAPHSEASYATVLWSACDEEPSPREAQGKEQTYNQGPPEQPLTETQCTVQTVSRVPPSTPQPQSANPWAAISDERGSQSTQHRSGDYRLLPDGSLRPQPIRVPKVGLWASTRFDYDTPNEAAFLKHWLMALQNHDFGTQEVWRQYCRRGADGTFDPRNHTAEFVRSFLFLYGSQPANFFTQNQRLGLLPAGVEQNILREFSSVYRATHVHNNPPHISSHWPPRPETRGPASPLAAQATQQRETHPDAQVTTHYHAAQWLTQYTLPPGWPQRSATQCHAAAWYSNTTPSPNIDNWHQAQWNWWPDSWSANWNWYSSEGWGGGWRW